MQIRHIFSTREDVPYKSGTLSVKGRMCGNVQYESVISSVQARMCNTSKVDHQGLAKGALLKNIFQ